MADDFLELQFGTTDANFPTLRREEESLSIRLLPPDEPPLSPIAGDIYVDKDANTFTFWTGKEWLSIGPSLPKTQETEQEEEIEEETNRFTDIVNEINKDE